MQLLLHISLVSHVYRYTRHQSLLNSALLWTVMHKNVQKK